MAKASTDLAPIDVNKENTGTSRIFEKGTALVMGDGHGYEVARKVTRETLSLEIDVPIFVQIVQPFTEPERDQETGKVIVRDGMESPWVAVVTDLEDGVEKNLVLNAVLKKNLVQTYREETYVEKAFAICKRLPPKGKRYALFDVSEIRPKTIDA